jgi:putative nucleotidyltransferase with HDIG domain
MEYDTSNRAVEGACVTAEAPELVLVVDDEAPVLAALRRSLSRHFDVRTALGGSAGLAALASEPYAVVLSDMHMPLMDGVTFLVKAAQLQPDAVRVMLTGSDAIATAISAINEARVFRFIRKPCSPRELRETLASALELHRVANAEAMFRASLAGDLARSHAELATTYDTTIAGWVHALALKDDDTAGHSERVTALAVALAQALGVRGSALEHLRRGAMLHDIGKMGVPDRILRKAGPLEADEWAIMRQHPVYAHRMLASIPFLAPAMNIPHFHHERWDGSGYPAGLVGTAIPFDARIFAVVDVWDALTTNRPYREALSTADARRHLSREAGRLFDPTIVDAFLALLV